MSGMELTLWTESWLAIMLLRTASSINGHVTFCHRSTQCGPWFSRKYSINSSNVYW